MLVTAATLLVDLVPTACSLGNVKQDDCKSDTECSGVFGLGSRCVDGFCSAGAKCTTGHDCREKFGGGACLKGACTSTLPTDPACPIVEPADLFDKSGVGDGSRLVIGGIFSLDETFDQAQMTAVRLAVREINRSGGMNAGQELGVVFCDNGGPGDTADGPDRTALSNHAIDYLSGTLGVPLVIGPTSSSDSQDLINRVTQRAFPTAIISPSATSASLSGYPDRVPQDAPYGFFWRTCPSDALQAKELYKLIGMDPTTIKVAVVYVQETYGEGLATGFQKLWGVSKTTLIPFSQGTDDLTLLGNQVEAAAPDAVIVVTFSGADTVSILGGFVGKTIATKNLFLTDSSKDSAGLLDPTSPAAVKAMIQTAVGTAPAFDAGPNYSLFATNLQKDFAISASSFSYLAQSYDAAYLGAYGLVYASGLGPDYDGHGVVEGLASVSDKSPSATAINVGPADWAAAKDNLARRATIDIAGASGNLDFDAATGDTPGPIEVWKVTPDFMGFETISVETP